MGTFSNPAHGFDLFTCKNVLYTRSHVFYSHGCNKFQHARTFFALTDTTFIPMGVMYLHARMFCTLARTSSIPMSAMTELETCFQPV